MSWLCRQCGILDISQPYRPPRPFIFRVCSYLTGNNPMGLRCLVRRYLYFLYVTCFRASQEKHLWASTAYYRDSFTFFYVDAARTSGETHLWASRSSYEDIFIFCRCCSLPWFSGHSFWLQTQRSRVRFPTPPDVLSSSGSVKGSTQPREDKWGATWKESSGSGLEN
jgi:hypothetical protein